MFSFKCKDIGMKDKFEVKTETETELMKLIMMHFETSHNMRPIPKDTMEKINFAVKGRRK